jgi:hypothetical protein
MPFEPITDIRRAINAGAVDDYPRRPDLQLLPPIERSVREFAALLKLSKKGEKLFSRYVLLG